MLRSHVATPESLFERFLDEYREEAVSPHEAAELAEWLSRRCQRFRGFTIRPNEIRFTTIATTYSRPKNSETNKLSGMGRH